jgi:transcription termination/antitermination protein NusA
MKNEFVLAFNEVLEDKQLPKDVILEALQAAMVSAYRRAVNASNAQQVEAAIDPDSGKVLIYAEKEVVESVADPRTEVALPDAQQVDRDAKIGSMVMVETTPQNFGRVAAQTARQVIQQRIREAERDQQFQYFSNQVGEIISGVIQATGNQAITLGLEMKTEGVMPRNQTVPGEKFRVHDRIRALLLEVKQSPRGPQITLSRAHRNFLRRLLENEVPEIYHGMIEIRSIAREPGQRSKVAVAALQPGVDPVGACVGLRGVRIQAIVRELNDEKIDVIEWNPDPSAYIAKALSPARVAGVYLNEQSKGAKTATVVVPEDQLSLAIGRDGQNARLAAKLTSWRIDIKSLPEAAADSLDKLQTDPNYAFLVVHEREVIPQIETILAKKSEGRPVTPEEYTTLSQFVDRVERGVIRQRQSEKRAEEERERIDSANIPSAAFDVLITNFEISDRLYTVISEAGFQTVGDIMLQYRMDPDSILRLNGMGPKGMTELSLALDAFEAKIAPPPEPVIEVEIPASVEEVPVETTVLEKIEETVLPETTVEGQAPSSVTEEPTLFEAIDVTEPQPERIIAEAETTEAGQAPQQGEAVSEAIPVVEEEVTSLDELFALQPEILDVEDDEEEDTDENDKDRKNKKKGKKKKFVEVEYDPERDVTLVRKKHKRGSDWEETW